MKKFALVGVLFVVPFCAFGQSADQAEVQDLNTKGEPPCWEFTGVAF